jgi:hypothetical protein
VRRGRISIFRRKERAKRNETNIGSKKVDVNDDALDVRNVLVMLERALKEAGLLTEVGDAGLVVVREHLVGEDGIGNLGCVHEVHLEETGLEGTLFGLVLLESVEEEGSCLLDHVLRHEDVDNL